jgi:uncharacterized protein (TIGR03435 family)
LVRNIALGALLITGSAIAQDTQRPISAAPEYQLISTVKPNHSGDARIRIRMDADAIYIQNASLKDILSNTYGTRNSLILNLPRWADTDHFDIQAKVLSDDANYLQHMTRVQRREIFQRLLSERFGVESHTETRTLPIYELVQAGRGPQLVEDPPPPPSDKPPAANPGRNGRGNTSVVGTSLEATGVRIADLCANLARILDRSVIDKSGLTSFYDITLTWKDERSDPADDSTAPSLFTALQEQLGLKLTPAKGPVNVLVLDKASPPITD